MAILDWAVACELATFDRQDRLCVIGVIRTFVVSELPFGVSQMMLVGRLGDIQPVDEVRVALYLVTPSGALAEPTESDLVSIEVSGEYVLATLRNVPFHEEGVYSFGLAVNDQPPRGIDIAVRQTRAHRLQELH